MTNKRNKGFTLIELVSLIVLIGIISATVIARMMGPSSFDALTAKDSLIQTARAAQQLALGRDAVTFTVTAAGDDWTVSANESGTPVHSVVVTGDAISLNTKTSALGGLSCANSTDDAALSGFAINYDGLGNAVTFSNGGPLISVSNGVRMCIDMSINNSVCIAASGFAYDGDCDD